MPKLTQPFFCTDAHGLLPDVGTVRRTGAGVGVLSRPALRNPPPIANTPAEKAGFLAARAAWLAIAPGPVWTGTHYVWKRTPNWPTFARNWYAATGSWAH
jgi:hypothetical protein